jgi:hypothetical protein
MQCKPNSTKSPSSAKKEAAKTDDIWLIANMNAVAKLSRTILNLDKAILKARQEAIPILIAKKSLFDTANTYLFISRDILSNINSNLSSNSIQSIKVGDASHRVRVLIRRADTMAVYALADIDYSKCSIYCTLEALPWRKKDLRYDFKRSLKYLSLANQYILLGLQCNIPRDL